MTQPAECGIKHDIFVDQESEQRLFRVIGGAVGDDFALEPIGFGRTERLRARRAGRMINRWRVGAAEDRKRRAQAVAAKDAIEKSGQIDLMIVHRRVQAFGVAQFERGEALIGQEMVGDALHKQQLPFGRIGTARDRLLDPEQRFGLKAADMAAVATAARKDEPPQ